MTDKKGTLLHVLKKKPVWWTEKTKQFSKRLPGIAHLFFGDKKLFNQERCQFSNIPFFRERCFFFDLSRAWNKEKILNGLHKQPAKTGYICQKLCGKMRPDDSSKFPKYHPLWVVKKTNKDISSKRGRKVKCRKKFNLRKKFWSLKWLQRPQKNRKTKI